MFYSPYSHSASQPLVAYSLNYSNQRNNHTPPMKCVSFTLTDINECDSSPCENGGTCEDQVNGYMCHCQSGYNGDHCQTGKTPSLIVSCVFLFFSFRLAPEFVSLVFVPEFQVVSSVLTNFTLTTYFIHPSGKLNLSIRPSNHPSITNSLTHTRFQIKMKIIIHLQ